MTSPERRTNTERVDSDRVFILRFWIERESAPDSVPIWRAKVSDVVSGEERHVNGVDAALECIRKSMATEPLG
jgi:hypothetical protein